MEGDEFFLFLNFGSTIILKVFRKLRGVLKYLNLIFLLIMKYLLLQGYNNSNPLAFCRQDMNGGKKRRKDCIQC